LLWPAISHRFLVYASNNNPEKRPMVWPGRDFAFLNEAVLCPKAANRK